MFKKNRPFSSLRACLAGVAIQFLPLWGRLCGGLSRSTTLFVLLTYTHTAYAETVYLAPDAFIEQSFKQKPTLKTLWLTADINDKINAILGHKYSALRLRYYTDDTHKTAWILDEIGKSKPITTGFTVSDKGIESMRVLIYRESHGYEVQYPSFYSQFDAVTLDDNHRLSKNIDGIAGATLSVNALTKLAQVALVLHDYVQKNP
jgi:hypothetical protein